MKTAKLMHSANQRNILIEIEGRKGEFDPRYAMDDKGATLRMETVFDARKWCKDNGYEVIRSLVPRKPLHMISEVTFLPALETMIVEAEMGLSAGKKEIEDLQKELAKKLEAFGCMSAALKCMKEDHEELLIQKEQNNG
jgi:hypothetical protein